MARRIPGIKPSIPDHTVWSGSAAEAMAMFGCAAMSSANAGAVKVVHKERFDTEAPFTRAFNGLQNFEPISRSHPGLVQILHAGRNDGYFYYVMELADSLEGELKELNGLNGLAYRPKTLESLLRANGRMPVAEVIELGLNLLSALAHLHQRGLIHRDIKPGNIILVNGQPKLADIDWFRNGQ
jgi:eukaryotic-like serine/threonine-protein kinase